MAAMPKIHLAIHPLMLCTIVLSTIVLGVIAVFTTIVFGVVAVQSFIAASKANEVATKVGGEANGNADVANKLALLALCTSPEFNQVRWPTQSIKSELKTDCDTEHVAPVTSRKVMAISFAATTMGSDLCCCTSPSTEHSLRYSR